MAAVAEGLRLAAPAGAPVVVLSLFDVDGKRGFRGDLGLGHDASPGWVGECVL